MSLPLDRTRVIEWTEGQLGPAASSMLGDLGADVIKMEPPGRGEGGRHMMSVMGRLISGLPEGPNYFFEGNNRSKRDITVDITKEEGKEIVYRLVATADVFLTNYRQQVTSRVGLDYKTLSQYNPKLIYAAGSAFGPDGPDSNHRGFDYLAQARSGLMTSLGEPGMPPLVAAGAISDEIGAVFLSYAVVIALLVREKRGIGQEVNASLLGSMIAAQSQNVTASTMVGAEFAKHDRARAGNPLWNHYKCADGKWLAFGMLWSDRCWPDFCRVMGIQHLQNNPRFVSEETRRANSAELISILDDIIITRPRNEWLQILDEAISRGADIVYSRLNTISDLADDPQVMANDYITTFKHAVLGDIKMVGLPYKFGKTPGAVGGSQHREAPGLGQHNEEVLRELGYTGEDIAALESKGVI
ncbi:MAG TPA: CoA transferase [Dehalococcoidia bacterium]|nr:CoA transferase [Dehalococcoidia bacterium]